MDGGAVRPEEQLLLWAARAHFDPDALPKFRSILERPLEWNHAMQIAESHGLLPLLFRQIEGTGSDSVPAPAFDHLKRRCREISLRMLLLTRELISLLRLLHAEGIAAVPYKGPALSAFLYGDQALRQSEDLDLMIPAQEVWRAKELLERHGFRPSPPLKREHLAAYSRGECDIAFAHSRPGLIVDLHWAFLPAYHGAEFQAAQFWNSLESMDLLGEKIELPSPDNYLMALCLHGSKHMWTRLGWVCDIAALLRSRKPPDCERTLRAAKNWRSERGLLLGLLIAHELLDSDLPQEILTRIRSNPEVAALARCARSRMFAGGAAGFWRLTWFRLRLIDGIGGRVSYCSHRLLYPSHNDLDWVRLPPPLFFLYFFLRPVRLVFGSARARLNR
jgi:hypothetical protein